MKVVIATSNQGKLKEFETLLAPLNWQFYSLQDLGIKSPIEDGATFYENALIKARHAATISGYPAIADDSGLCVDCLNGAPGIKSARYAGENSSDAENNLKLLESVLNNIALPVFVLVRPRGGHFFYKDDELDIMLASINDVKNMGAKGIVSGALNSDKTIDSEATLKLINFSEKFLFRFPHPVKSNF